MAHAMRAILLARATAATLIGRRSIRRASQSRFVPCWRAYRMTAIAPATSSQRKCRLPCFEILPSLSLPPVECCRGTKPIHAARLRPDENTFQSPTSATSAVATIGPTPGISSSRRLSSLERCQAWIRFSMAKISSLIAAYWRARMPRLNRAAAGMRSSCSCEEVQQLRSSDAPPHHHRAINIYPVNLKNRLRDIETDRANLAHGRLPSKWCVSTQPLYGTLMPQSGRRPQHQLRLTQRKPHGHAGPLGPESGQRGSHLCRSALLPKAAVSNRS